MVWLIGIIVICSLVLVLTLMFSWVTERYKQTHTKQSILEYKESRVMGYEDFESNWSVKKYGNRIIQGYKRLDIAGCYAILIFDKEPSHGNFSTYTNVYVGQSIHLGSRVHKHLTGSGNGDVYADIKYGKYVYVKLYACGADNLNRLERQLISRYKAIHSYNRTRGGAKIA